MSQADSRMRLLIESLPGPASWTLLVKLIILQTGNCKTFVQQCSDNTTARAAKFLLPRSDTKRGDDGTDHANGRSPLAEALSWEPLARIHLRIITGVYVYLLLKYRLLSLLSEEFGYLDCMLLGRFRFIGRTNKISGEIVSIILTCFFLYRWTLHLYVPKFKFSALEFLMSGQQACKVGHRTTRMPIKINNARFRASNYETQYKEKFYRVNKVSWQPRADESTRNWPNEMNSIIYLKNPFDGHESRWFLRPNRTRASWLTLSLWTKLMLYCSAIMLVPAYTFGILIMGGSILTNLGFEMSYPACVSWLRNIQTDPGQSSLSNYSHIYLAPRVLAHEIPIDDIPARIPLDTGDLSGATLYTIGRITADILENFVIFTEFTLTFWALFYTVATHSLDVILNANAIGARLRRLLDKLDTRMGERGQEETRVKCYLNFIIRTQQSCNPLSLNTSTYEKEMSLNSLTPIRTSDHAHHHQFGSPHQNMQRVTTTMRSMEFQDEQLNLEIVELQAILADHFYTITRGYNLHLTFLLGLIGLCWLLYTITICIWMSTIKSRAIELEFVIAETNMTIFCLLLTIGAALVRSRNLQLYSLITRAMALDPDHSLTKPRWISILKYFYPKPFHCFTIFGSTEISVLLGLKIISWILSAFIVLANFFYVNTI